MSKSNLQHQVDGMLRRGIFFSIFWLMGVGSLIAIIQAVKARKIIRQSNGEIRGSGKVMWCFIVGGAVVLGLRYPDGCYKRRDHLTGDRRRTY
jgi:hypothetical protein